MLVAVPGRTTTFMAPAFSLTGREEFESRVNLSDYVCDATLDTVLDSMAEQRVFMRDPDIWKGEGLPARFEVNLGGLQWGGRSLDRTQGRRYRMLLYRAPRTSTGRFGSEIKAGTLVPVLLEPLPVWRASFEYERATVDTIVARARFDTLCAQAELIVLAHDAGYVMHDRDGKPVPSWLLRIDRALKGAKPGDTIVYQAPYRLWRTGKALLFLKRHGPKTWEAVWPGAGVHEFDERNRDLRTHEPLQTILLHLERVLGPAFVR